MLNTILHEKRKVLGLKIQEISSMTGIDQGLLSKYESGKRKPSGKHLISLSQGYDIPYKELKNEFIVDKLVDLVRYEIEPNELFMMAESRVEFLNSRKTFELPELSAELAKKLTVLDTLQKQWSKNKPLNGTQLSKMKAYFALKYTYDSNRIEGNTLTLQETQLVVGEGMTIGGKSMKEHLEAVNHSEAMGYLERLITENEPLTRRTLLDLHRLVLRSIDSDNAGRYRGVPVTIGGSEFMPPQPFLLDKLMEDYFIHYTKRKNDLHPVLLAAEMHERLVSIHPFLDGNGRTARLIMNFILLQHGYTVTILKGDTSSRLKYYNALENVQLNNNPEPFYHLIIERSMASLNEHLSLA